MSFHITKSPRLLSKKKSLHARRNTDHFSELYPTRANIPKFIKDTAEIYLYYQRTKLKAVVPLYVETVYLEQIFYEVIFKFEQALQPEKAIKETSKVIGFQSIDNDILLDYRITIGNGILDRIVNFKCMVYKGNKKIQPLQKYKIVKCLAIGGFSKVYLVRSYYDGKFYALKAVSKQFVLEGSRQRVLYNQRSVCSKLDHPFIVSLKHCFQSSRFACFVFEYCPGGQLFYYLKAIKRMSEQNAKFYFLQILYGLEYLHQKGIVYRDLKPQNLLIGIDGHLKIADFGLSKQNMDPSYLTYSFCGSVEYMCPEMILKTGHSYEVDYYTLGALLYELVTGLPPYYSLDQQELKSSILNDQLSFPKQIQLSNEFKMLLKGLLNKNRKQRLGSLKGIKQILFHPWLGKVNSDTIIKKKLIPPYIPDVNQFNFDQTQLGQDQQIFTTQLILDSKTREQYQQQFPNFYFQGQFNLRAQQYKILKDLKPSKILSKQMRKTNHIKSSSLKALNTSTNYFLNKDFSSPYFESLNKKQRYSLQTNNQNSSLKILLKSKPKKRLLPKYINAFIVQTTGIRKSRKNNFQKIL